MLVEVRPLPLKKWHEKSGKEDFTRPKVIEALYDEQTQKYSTGLTEEDKVRLGKLTGFDLSDNFNHEQPHPFWNTAAAMIKLPNSTTIFDTSKPLDEIKVKILKASKFVANSMKEWEEGLWPDAHHVIFDEQEEVEIKAKKVELKNKATSLSLKMSKDEKINIIQILSDKSARGMSDDFVNVEIDKIVTEKPVEFVKYAEMDNAMVYIRAAVLEAIHRNILTKDGSAIYYMGDQVGFDIESTIEYFSDVKNQKLKAIILEKLNS
jgi:hypothetical protein